MAQPVKPEKTNFYDALKAMMNGKKARKLDWGDAGFWAEMNSGLLKLHKPDGKLYDFILSQEDIAGEDWIILNWPKL